MVGSYDAKEPFSSFYCLLGEFEFLIYTGYKMNECKDAYARYIYVKKQKRSDIYDKQILQR